jgi:hypothetical protein
MPSLKNPKHELFIQSIAKGMTQEDAHYAAGYRCKRTETAKAAASRLLTNVNLARRLAELQGREAKETKETVIGVTADLRAMYDQACSMTQTYGPAAVQAATRALMGIAKVNGLIINHVVHERKDLVDLSERELMDIINRGRDAKHNGSGVTH